MKIIELYKLKKEENKSLLGTFTAPEEGTFEEFYNANAAYIDRDVSKLYSDLLLDQEEEEEIDSDILASYKVNKWQIDKLWEIHTSEYNPLYNVDGDTITTTDYSEKRDTDVIGEATDTTRIGQRSSSGTTTNKEASFESTSFSNSDQSISSTQSDQATDTMTKGQHTDTHTEGAHTVTISERRYGNIGVTKSTELLESQQAFVAKFNAVKSIMLLIFSDCCQLYYE